MIASTINLTIFIMMIIIYLNEMRHISMFIFNFNYIKDLSKIIMEQKCNNIYCEAETDRYQIAKNSYNLRMPNDVFNSKTYTIFVFIISILVFIYYHYILFENKTSSKSYYVLNILLLIILLTIIIYRYVPNNDAGYLNYFKDTSSTLSNGIIGISLGLIGAILITYVNTDSKNYNTYICYVISIIILLNLMNIVMSFRSNTKPMLKTKSLLWSIKKSIDNYVNNSDMSYTDGGAAKTLTYIGDDLKDEIVDLKELIKDGKYNKTTKQTIAYYMKILIAFKELSKIYSKSLSNDTGSVADYIKKLKKDIKDNVNNIKKDDETTEADADIYELSLIFDKEINLPITYNGEGGEHNTNANTANAEYVYTADISYDNPNLFYEKYWDMNEIGNNSSILIPQFLHRYDYFTPTFLFGTWRPNLFKILMLIIVSIVVLLLIDFVLKSFAFISDSEVFKNILPLFMLGILILYIIAFISFNTWFNKYVVYKCLDSSYKRSLNKLNNITTPYIRLYDNKIVNGNKNYLHNYIITNVFYSLLNGNIKLKDDVKIKSIYDAIQATTETQTKMREIIKLIIGLSAFYDNGIVPTAADKLLKFTSKRKEVTDKIANAKTLLESIDTYIKAIPAVAAITSQIKTITDAIANIITNISGVSPALSVKNYIDTKTPASDTEALKLAKQVDISLSKTLTDIEDLKTKILKINANDGQSEPIKSKDDYYNIPKIKSSRLQFTNINSGILSDENGFRDYYKETFKDIYDVKHEPANAATLYKVFDGLFAEPSVKPITTEANIDTYFKTTIIKKDNIKNIYYIIKKCFNMFDENKFNSNLAYYNDAENKQKGINISSYNKFSFQKNNNKIIPYKFVLKLDTTSARDEFTKDLSKDEETEFDILIKDFLNDPTQPHSGTNLIDTTKILDNSEEDLLSQASDIEKKQNKNLIKIIAKYLLILGHINYNRIEYDALTGANAVGDKKIIYEKKTYKLYKLISDTLYNDTYDIDDTFQDKSKTKEANALLKITDTYKRYKNLTYIYNYLETKYVSISSNNNNSNYLMNIIKSINNKINNDDKTFKNASKDAKYLFRDYIDRKDNKEDYENEEDILNIANNISTTTLGGTYIFNIILLIIVVSILK
jgi:hypothetical protein